MLVSRKALPEKQELTDDTRSYFTKMSGPMEGMILWCGKVQEEEELSQTKKLTRSNIASMQASRKVLSEKQALADEEKSCYTKIFSPTDLNPDIPPGLTRLETIWKVLEKEGIIALRDSDSFKGQTQKQNDLNPGITLHHTRLEAILKNNLLLKAILKVLEKKWIITLRCSDPFKGQTQK